MSKQAVQLILEKAAILYRKAKSLLPLLLFAGVTIEQQIYIFEPTLENTRNVVILTNIAEALVIIDGTVFYY